MMVDYISQKYINFDAYFVMEKKCVRGWIFARRTITFFNPRREKFVSLCVWWGIFRRLKIEEMIKFDDPLFERICKITRDFDPRAVRLYRKNQKRGIEYQALVAQQKKFIDHVLCELDQRVELAKRAELFPYEEIAN